MIPRTAAEAVRVAAATAPAMDFSAPEAFEARPGGAATAPQPVDANFRKLWVTAPASTRVSDGLGPL